jgi:hypothetical protein
MAVLTDRRHPPLDQRKRPALTTATTGEARVEIDAAPLTVYQLISDIARMGEWSPECYRCEWLNGATTAAVGAKFRGHNRLGKASWTTDAIITAADPGREFAFTVLHKNGREETLWRYELRQFDAGTEVGLVRTAQRWALLCLGGTGTRCRRTARRGRDNRKVN